MNFLKLEKAFCNPILACFLIVLTCAVIYSNSLDGPFLFDDNRSIAENEKIRDVSNFLRFDQIRMKRPFVDLTFALNYRFGQLNVRPFHVTNVLIHMMTGVIVYFLSCAILRRLLRPTGDPPPIPHHESRNTRHKTPIPLIGLFTALIFV
ncbi:MAG TPA: hypothetical protein HPP59_06400, partial [Deltaproteobacteria bacterium]|nr:hypothetical protein [Deltaproteobacteria bacterium]